MPRECSRNSMKLQNPSASEYIFHHPPSDGRSPSFCGRRQVKATPHNSSAALAMPFSPSAACRFLDLPPVNLRNLQLHLTKNSFATAPTHLCGVALKVSRWRGDAACLIFMLHGKLIIRVRLDCLLIVHTTSKSPHPAPVQNHTKNSAAFLFESCRAAFAIPTRSPLNPQGSHHRRFCKYFPRGSPHRIFPRAVNPRSETRPARPALADARGGG